MLNDCWSICNNIVSQYISENWQDLFILNAPPQNSFYLRQTKKRFQLNSTNCKVWSNTECCYPVHLSCSILQNPADTHYKYNLNMTHCYRSNQQALYWYIAPPDIDKLHKAYRSRKCQATEHLQYLQPFILGMTWIWQIMYHSIAIWLNDHYMYSKTWAYINKHDTNIHTNTVSNTQLSHESL